jgi:hypothetical protein
VIDQHVRPSDPDGAFTIDSFCKWYGQSRSSAYREINAGRLVAKKRGTRVLIDRSEARRWFEDLPRFEFKAATTSSKSAA